MMAGGSQWHWHQGTAQLPIREKIVCMYNTKSLDEIMHMTYLTITLKVETTHRINFRGVIRIFTFITFLWT